MIHLCSDNSIFVISKTTLNKYPNCAFAKVHNGDVHSHIYNDNNVMYVDIQPENLRQIIKMMRYDNFDNDDPMLQKDLELLKFKHGEHTYQQLGGIFTKIMNNVETESDLADFNKNLTNSLLSVKSTTIKPRKIDINHD